MLESGWLGLHLHDIEQLEFHAAIQIEYVNI